LKEQVPIRDYEDLKPYVEKVVNGENILWKGKPLYFAKTSGTTSGAKYIPLSESMPYHIEAARNAILLYIHETGKADFVDGKMIFCKEVLFWKKNTESSLVDYQDCSTFYSQISTEKKDAFLGN
jgi:hypothetical protein